MTPEEFDISFDFDKNYGTDPNGDKCSFDDDFDLDAALARELGPDFDRLFEEEYAASQAALNAQFAASSQKEDMDATRVRLEIGYDDDDDDAEENESEDDSREDSEEIRTDPIFGGFVDYADEEDDLDENEGRRSRTEDEPVKLRQDPMFGGFVDFDDEDETMDEHDDPDEDLSAVFAAASTSRNPFIDHEPEAEAVEAPKAKKAPSKIDLSGVCALFGVIGAAIADNARRFGSALKVCKPGKMDRQARRRFKDDVLPVLIGAAALVVCMIFIIGSLSRNFNSEDRKQAALQESIAQAEAEAAAAREIQDTLDTAAAQAAGYDYQAAIDTLDGYKTDDRGLTEEMAAARAEYAEAVNNLVIWDDPTAIPNLSFHLLIEDPERAYADSLASSYKSNFVTTAQFSSILEQLYANGYVLVNLASCLTESTDADGAVTCTVQPIYLPEGKKPIMITETLVNYFAYMVDGNDDGTPDAQGAGFANKLMTHAGGIVASYIDAEGNEQLGDYDLVPILNTFIGQHPDFSYRGAKAILAVTGDEGVFGWRTTGGDEAAISGAREVVEALRADGYQIACNSYANLNYGTTSLDEIKADLSKWEKDVEPVLGEIDILVVARGGELASDSSRFQALREAGFLYILDAGSAGSALTDGCFYQNRTMVLGSEIQGSAYEPYFTLASA